MADRPDEPAFCPSCGELLPILAEKNQTIWDLEKELRAKRAIISRLRADRNDQEAMDPLAKDAREVFDFWRQEVEPNAREFSGERFEKVTARLRSGITVAELKRACQGAKLRPYVTKRGRSARGAPDERYTDLALICRSEAYVQRFISYVEAEERGQAPPPAPLSRERLVAWQEALDRADVLERLRQLKGWKPEVVVDMGLGLDGSRVVFPVYDSEGRFVGAHRYQPNPERRNGTPKLVAQGVRDLFPAPESLTAGTIWLVEGEADAVAMRSIGLPAVGVPGVATWKPDWAARFERFDRVLICFDCDDKGREAAQDRLHALATVTEAQVVELDREREDGFDVGDLLADHADDPAFVAARLSALTVAPAGPQPRRDEDEGDGLTPWERIVGALEGADCCVVARAPGRASAQCPVHDDRVPSMSLTEGDDGRVLLHCHAGCEAQDIVEALGLDLRDLFA